METSLGRPCIEKRDISVAFRLIRLAAIVTCIAVVCVVAAQVVGRGMSQRVGHWLKLGDRYPTDIYMVDRQRQVFANLTKNPANDTYMAESPDEQYLAFIS